METNTYQIKVMEARERRAELPALQLPGRARVPSGILFGSSTTETILITDRRSSAPSPSWVNRGHVSPGEGPRDTWKQLLPNVVRERAQRFDSMRCIMQTPVSQQEKTIMPATESHAALRRLRRLWTDDRGEHAIEFLMILTFGVLPIIAAVFLLEDVFKEYVAFGQIFVSSPFF
jgi:hypothetical protein